MTTGVQGAPVFSDSDYKWGPYIRIGPLGWEVQQKLRGNNHREEDIFATSLKNIVIDIKIKAMGLLCMVIKYMLLYTLECTFTETA